MSDKGKQGGSPVRKPVAKRPAKDQEERSILINFVLDKSGSMGSIREATISGFNEFLGDQQREGGDARMTLTMFDTEFDTVANAIPAREMAPLDLTSYVPDGLTALYDSIGYTMRLTDDYVVAHNPDQVLFVIMTDGEENSSREFDQKTVFEMIRERQKHAGYEFIYLGANQDAYAASESIGISASHALAWEASPATAAATMTRVSHNVRAYRRDGAPQQCDGAFFSEAFEEAGAVDYDEHRRREESQ